VASRAFHYWLSVPHEWRLWDKALQHALDYGRARNSAETRKLATVARRKMRAAVNAAERAEAARLAAIEAYQSATSALENRPDGA